MHVKSPGGAFYSGVGTPLFWRHKVFGVRFKVRGELLRTFIISSGRRPPGLAVYIIHILHMIKLGYSLCLHSQLGPSSLAICTYNTLVSSLCTHPQLSPSGLAVCMIELGCSLYSHPQLGPSGFTVHMDTTKKL